MALLVQRPTVDRRSGLNLGVISSSPTLGSVLSVKPALKKQGGKDRSPRSWVIKQHKESNLNATLTSIQDEPATALKNGVLL